MRSLAGRACAFLLLVLADSAFLWMFFSADPLEQLGRQVRGTVDSRALAALRFAADWRHGMAGNSWIFMPGFFATAAALWLHARLAPYRLAHAECIAAGVLALAAAIVGAPAGSIIVVRAFSDANGTQFATAVPPLSVTGMFSGAYTLVSWSVFVLACRQALKRRTFRPFVVPAILAIGLVGLRPWTVDDFVSYWATGIGNGDAVAQTSFALAFAVAALLAASERRSAKPEPREAGLPNDKSAGANERQRRRSRKS